MRTDIETTAIKSQIFSCSVVQSKNFSLSDRTNRVPQPDVHDWDQNQPRKGVNERWNPREFKSFI